MIPNRLLIFAATLFFFGCTVGKARVDGRTANIFAGATKVEFFRIDGRNDPPDPTRVKPGDPTVGGYAILARGKDQGQEFASRLRSILTDHKTYTDDYAHCFWPGVAFRVWKGEECVDIIICFTCGNFYLGPPTEKRVMENASFRGSPNRARLVQLAKEAFPDDQEVQGLNEQ